MIAKNKTLIDYSAPNHHDMYTLKYQLNYASYLSMTTVLEWSKHSMGKDDHCFHLSFSQHEIWNDENLFWRKKPSHIEHVSTFIQQVYLWYHNCYAQIILPPSSWHIIPLFFLLNHGKSCIPFQWNHILVCTAW